MYVCVRLIISAVSKMSNGPLFFIFIFMKRINILQGHFGVLQTQDERYS